MGQTCTSCYAPPRQNACSERVGEQWTSRTILVHHPCWIWWSHGTDPQGGLENPTGHSEEGCPTIFQHWPSSIIWPLHLPCSCTSSNQHACTRHAITWHQQVPDAKPFWWPNQYYMGALPWNNTSYLAIDSHGGQDQTCELVIPPKSTEMPPTNLWGLLHWQTGIECRPRYPILGRTRTSWFHGEKGQRPARDHRGCDVSRITWSPCAQSWRQWKRSTQRGWKGHSHHSWEVHDCP